MFVWYKPLKYGSILFSEFSKTVILIMTSQLEFKDKTVGFHMSVGDVK